MSFWVICATHCLSYIQYLGCKCIRTSHESVFKLWWVCALPENKEQFLNQLAHVILVHNWYCCIITCFYVYSREYMCSACCHEFWTSLTWVVLGQNWYGSTGTCHHVKNLWFHGKHVLTHQICSQNLVNLHTKTRELSQLNSWIQLQNMWNHRWLFAGLFSRLM